MTNRTLVGGIWVPKNESHLTGYLKKSASENKSGKGSYQLNTLGVFLDHVPSDRRRVALDIGGHVGLWSMHLGRYFDRVVAFEPIPLFRECFELNVWGADRTQHKNVELRAYGLGDVQQELSLSVEPDNSGHTHILPTDPDKHIASAEIVNAMICRLDDENFDIVDAIKIDVEGFEPAVLMGAEQTIKKHKPIICMEQKPHGFYGWEQYHATRILMGWGAKPVKRVVDDFMFAWD